MSFLRCSVTPTFLLGCYNFFRMFFPGFSSLTRSLSSGYPFISRFPGLPTFFYAYCLLHPLHKFYHAFRALESIYLFCFLGICFNANAIERSSARWVSVTIYNALTFICLQSFRSMLSVSHSLVAHLIDRKSVV